MKYRSRTDIIAMILRSALGGGSTKTRLMYSAYLSYAQLKEYLQFLQERELLAYEEGTQLYKLTEKSLQLLRVFDEMHSMITLDDSKPATTSVAKKPQVAHYQF